MRNTLTSNEAGAEVLTDTSSSERLLEMVTEFFIGEASCLKTAPDQVNTRRWLRVKVVYECPKSAPDPIADHGVANLPADRVRYGH